MHASFQAHGSALGGCERNVGDIIGVVAADEGEEGDDNVDDKDDADEKYGPCTEGYSFYDGVYRGPGMTLALDVPGERGPNLRCVLQYLDLFCNTVPIDGEKQKARVEHDSSDVALVKSGSVLATRDLVKLWMPP